MLYYSFCLWTLRFAWKKSNKNRKNQSIWKFRENLEKKGITFSNVKNSAFSLERLYRLYVSFYLILKNSSNFVYISTVPSIWRFLLNKIQICLGKFQLLLWLSGICGSSGSSGFILSCINQSVLSIFSFLNAFLYMIIIVRLLKNHGKSGKSTVQ